MIINILVKFDNDNDIINYKRIIKDDGIYDSNSIVKGGEYDNNTISERLVDYLRTNGIIYCTIQEEANGAN
jgi:hypothetical protein